MNIDAFILIGGQSKRFGAEKAFAEIDGTPLACRAAETVGQALNNNRIRYIARDEKQFPDELIGKLLHPVVYDIEPGFGSWSAVHSALSHSRADLVFVLACDMPFITTEFVRRITNAIDEYDAAVPFQPDGLPQPLCAAYRRNTCLAAVESVQKMPGKLPPIREVFELFKSRFLTAEEYEDLSGAVRFFVNTNTPDEFRSAAEQIEG